MRDAVIVVGLAVVAALAWYLLWVRPHDQFMREVTACMAEHGNTSPATYDHCVGEVRD